jgi:O-antigen ligase
MTARNMFAGSFRAIEANRLAWYWPAAMALVIAPLCAWFLFVGRYEYAAVAAIAVPLAVLVLRDPFIGLLLWVILIHFVVTRESATVSTTQWVLHRAGILLLIGLVAVYHAAGLRRSLFRLAWYDVALAGFVIVAIFNVLAFSSQGTRDLASLHDKLIVPIALFWLVRAISPDRKQMTMLVMTGLFVLLVQIGVGVFSWFAPEILPSHWLDRAGSRTTGTLGGPAPFTVTVVLFGLLVLHRIWEMRPSLEKLVLAGTLAASGLVVFLSLSRGSWLGAGAVVLVLAVVYRRSLLWPAIAVAVVGVLLLAGPLADQAELAEERAGVTSTLDSRTITNVAAVRMIEDRPLFGFGFGRFEDYDERYKTRVGEIPLETGGSAHNTYLNLAAEMGLPATALYFAPVIGLLWLSVTRRNLLPDTGPYSRRLVLFLWLALLDMFLVCNFMEMVQSSAWATGLWWLTLGLIAVALDRQRQLAAALPARPAEI